MVDAMQISRPMFALLLLARTLNAFTRPNMYPLRKTLDPRVQHESGHENTAHHALLDPDLMETVGTSLLSSATTSSSPLLLSNDGIKTAFSVATFLPQPFWLLLILLPNSDITKKIMGNLSVPVVLSLVHFFIVSASIGQPDDTAPMLEFADVFDPNGDPQQAMVGMMRYRNFVSEEWSHVLTWDLFVGRWIWLDGLERGIFTPHSVLLCNLIGPPGLLLHLLTSLITGKAGGFTSNEALDIEKRE